MPTSPLYDSTRTTLAARLPAVRDSQLDTLTLIAEEELVGDRADANGATPEGSTAPAATAADTGSRDPDTTVGGGGSWRMISNVTQPCLPMP